MSSLPFRPSNKSDSFLLASVDPDCEITTGAETGCCKSGNEGCDWVVKRPFARSHVLTPSRLVGNFPPSHPELGGGGVVGSGWVVEVDGDDNAVGELNFWKRRVSEACCDKFRSRENSGEAWGVREEPEPELRAENSSAEGVDTMSGEDALSDRPLLRVRRSSSSLFTPGKMPGKGNNLASPPYFCKVSVDAGGTGDAAPGELGKYVEGRSGKGRSDQTSAHHAEGSSHLPLSVLEAPVKLAPLSLLVLESVLLARSRMLLFRDRLPLLLSVMELALLARSWVLSLCDRPSLVLDVLGL
jgi:hypothetical protein